MKVKLICTGKNSGSYISGGINDYASRIERYIPFEIIYTKSITKIKTNDIEIIKKLEFQQIAQYINKGDTVVILDEKGKEFTSAGFSQFMNKKMISGIKNLIFIIGGAYGFSNDMIKMCNEKISLSKMTFPHQLIRLFFLEQMYRAMTILKNEPYHNE